MGNNQSKRLSLAEKIFSVRNEGSRKVIRILGLKIRFRTPRLVYRELNERLERAQALVDALRNNQNQQAQNFSDTLKALEQAQTLNAELQSKLVRQAEDYTSRINAVYVKLMYRLQEYCPDEKRSTALKDWFFECTGETLNLENPQTFNEKIQWLKLYDSTPLKNRLVDKYAVRGWIKEKIGEQYLVPLLGVWDRFEDIDFDTLPEKFVLKCNHGSGYNIIVTDKSKLDWGGVERRIKSWMDEEFAFRNGFELQYSSISRKIIAEKYIENCDRDLYDYKFWCFDGKVRYIQFISERFTNGAVMAFYDRNWKKQDFVYNHPLDQKTIDKPDNLELMIKLAEKLAQGFCYVRVDFYDVNNRIYFGEMTFTSDSGTGRWIPEEMNLVFGKMIKLPKL